MTVYQRILKPFPQVAVAPGPGAVPGIAPRHLFLTVSLFRSADGLEISELLQASPVAVPAEGVGVAAFKRLKILATSGQQQSLFFLRFQLKFVEGSELRLVPGSNSVDSIPIEVFSHTSYIMKSNPTIESQTNSRQDG